MPRDSSDLKDTRPLLAKKTSVNAKWKEAKAYMMAKDFKLAKKMLTELADVPNRYREKAAKLLQEIE